MDDRTLDFYVLDAVHEGDGCVTQRDISERICRSLCSVNFALRLLAAKGYIKIIGTNSRRLHYHITPSGIIHKSILAYNFVKRQSGLYEQVRRDFLGKLIGLKAGGVNTVSFYGWTPLTESAILQVILEGIEPKTIYVRTREILNQWNRIPLQPISAYKPDSDVLVLMEVLPEGWDERIETGKIICYPVA